MWSRSLRRLLSPRDDSGFSLLETVLAMVIAGIMFSAISGVMITGTKASVLARQNQQAGDLLNEKIEWARSLSYAGTTMVTGDATIATDPLIDKSGVFSFNPGTGAEPLALLATGSVNPHTSPPVLRNKTSYSVSTYVTCPAESPACATAKTGVLYRRVTVVVSWTAFGTKRERRSSTIVTETRRGLPLPYFRFFTTSQQISAAVGGNMIVSLSLRNLGARDAWNLSTASSGWTFYRDSDTTGTVGAWDGVGGADPQMTVANGYDVDANGVPDTGFIETNATVRFYAVRTAALADVGSTTVSFTALSAASPTASTASQTLSVRIDTAAYSCPGGCIPVQTYLHNQQGTSAFTNSVALSPMTMDTVAPTRVPTFAYSTDVDAIPGRFLQSGGIGPRDLDVLQNAVWLNPMRNACTLKGGAIAEVVLWVLPPSGVASGIDVWVGSDTNTTLRGQFVVAGTSGTVTLPPTAVPAWTRITFAVPIPADFALGRNDNIGVAAAVRDPASSNIRIAYDNTSFPAGAKLPLIASAGRPCL